MNDTINIKKGVQLVYWSSEEDRLLKELYARKASKPEVLKVFPNRSYGAIKHRAKTLKIKKIRLQYKNELFFQSPNESNCSVAGILASDGCIRKKKIGQDCNKVMIGVKTEDIQLLESFLSTVGSNAVICNQKIKRTFVPSIHTRIKQTTTKEYFFSSVCFSACEKWIPNLEKHWNITEHKSLTLKAPNINELNLSLAYICGLISGDGSIGLGETDNKKYLYIRLLGTQELLNWVKLKFEEYLKEAVRGEVRPERKNSNIFFLQINGIQAIKLFDKMNSLDCVKLTRKWANPEILKIIDDCKRKNPEPFDKSNLIKNLLTQYNVPFTIVKDYFHVPSKGLNIRICNIFKYSSLNNCPRSQLIKDSPETPESRFINIYETELKNKPKIVISRLKHYLGLIKHTIHARKCEIRLIDAKLKNKFLNKYHIQGEDYGSNIYLGLFYKNRLVNVMTFAKKEESYDLTRFAGINHFNVVGGASKLLNYFEKTYQPKHIYSFADKRWSGGNLYFKLGFQKTKENPATYFYFRPEDCKLYHKFGFRRKYLPKKLSNFNASVSEWDNMKGNGWNKVWDCGLIKFEKRFTNYCQ